MTHELLVTSDLAPGKVARQPDDLLGGDAAGGVKFHLTEQTMIRCVRWLAPALLCVLPALAAEDGFKPLFNGVNLDGWMGGKYEVEDGVLVCPKDGGGTILTEKQYANFELKLKFRFGPGANNGLAIRTPAQGNPAYVGMELQILDNEDAQYANLRPAQYHGSVYDVFPAKRGFLKKPGEWNEQHVLVDERRVKVTLNGEVICDADLSTVTDEAILKAHPGLLRATGHIGFMGHGHRVEFKDILIKELPRPDGTPPPGFENLFNGTDLTGWKGLVATPPKRAAMTPEQLAAEQARADEVMRAHWRVVDGVLEFDGKGKALCTSRDYGDFEFWVDWKIKEKGDSGIYLRGSPQVQIWDPAQHPEGSGGLYNNQKNPNKPLRCADNPIEQWNNFIIRMVGEKVWVWLNGYLVVDNVTMENYWERDKPIYPTGQIELQDHGNTLWFKNIYVKEIPRG